MQYQLSLTPIVLTWHLKLEEIFLWTDSCVIYVLQKLFFLTVSYMWKHSMLSNLVLLQCISILFSWCLSNVTQINVFSAKSNLKQGKWKTNWNNLFGRATWCSSGCSKQDLSAAFWNWKVACLTLMKVYNHWILWSYDHTYYNLINCWSKDDISFTWCRLIPGYY